MDIKVNVRELNGKRPVSVVDLENVRYIDSTGLGVLIGGLKRVREHSGAVNLVCTNPQIKKIFDITGLVKIFGIFDNEAQACENL